MDAKHISDLADQVGVVAFYKMSDDELRTAICTVSKELKDVESRYLSATWLYRETGAKTEWLISKESDERQMQIVWIIKRVTRFADSDRPKVEESNVMLVPRNIANRMIELLNSQMGTDLPA